MALSAESLELITQAQEAIDAFYTNRLAEVDRDVRNLEAYGTPINDLGDSTIEAGADSAEEILSRVGITVS